MRLAVAVSAQVAALVAFGCADGANPSAVTRTDSSGVEVVTNHTLEATEWLLSDAPLLNLGSIEGGGAEEFFDVTDAKVLPGATLAVLNAGSQELRLFDRRGRLARSSGGPGEGPGEFYRPEQVVLFPPDSVGVWDPWVRRLTVFDRGGRVARTARLPAWDASTRILSLVDGGQRILMAGLLFEFPDDLGTRLHMVDWQYLVVDPSGNPVDTLPREPFGLFGRVGEAFERPHLDADGGHAAAAAGYWTGSGRSEEVRFRSFDGSVVRVVRWPTMNRLATADHLEALVAERLRAVDPAAQPEVRRRLEGRPVADSLPAYGRLLTDDTGALWVEKYRAPGADATPGWLVFDSSGVLVGHVTVPERFEVLEVGEAYVLGVFRDDVSVEYVRIYGLER